jgi:hypothetical protein
MPHPDPLPSIKTPWGAAPPISSASPDEVTPILIPDHTLIRCVGSGSYGEVCVQKQSRGEKLRMPPNISDVLTIAKEGWEKWSRSGQAALNKDWFFRPKNR